MRLGIFGGTFNPIHVGHLRVAEEVREALSLEKVIFVPSHMPPHKELADKVGADRRLEIVRVSIRGNPRFEVSPFEVDRPGSSYSIRTIEHVRETYGCTPHFILGMDAFNEISAWYQSARLFDLAHFIVMTRPDSERRSLADVLGPGAARFVKTDSGFVNELGNEILFVTVTGYAISSSRIRELCKQGRSIRYLVSEAAEEYIRRERIYAFNETEME